MENVIDKAGESASTAVNALTLAFYFTVAGLVAYTVYEVYVLGKTISGTFSDLWSDLTQWGSGEVSAATAAAAAQANKPIMQGGLAIGQSSETYTAAAGSTVTAPVSTAESILGIGSAYPVASTPDTPPGAATTFGTGMYD